MDATIAFSLTTTSCQHKVKSPAPLLSVQTTKDAAITFSLTTTSCPHKVNKSCTSVQTSMDAAMDVQSLFIDHYFLSAQGQ